MCSGLSENKAKGLIGESDLFKKFTNFCATLKTEAIVFADGDEKQGTSSLNTASSSLKEKNRKEQSTTPSSSSIRVSPASEILEDVSVSPENLEMKEEKQFEFILKSLVAGGVAGMCAKTSVAPLDRMKILLQAHSKHYSHLGVFSGLRGIVKKERFIALYKGNGAQMVRIFPYAATQFTSFEMYKKLLGGEKSHIGRFAAGSAAGVTAVALTYPLDTIRARLAFQVTGEHVYNGIYSCAVHIFREEGGVRALYRGFVPTVCGMIPYAGLSFYCFESFKYLCMKYIPDYTCKSHSTNTGGLVLLLHAKLLCGGVAGAAAQTVAYPLDVTRRRMQLAMMDEKTKKFGMGMVSTLKLIYEENGVMRGLYRGMSINYLRAIPMVAVSFSTYELVKQTLNLDTGIAIKTG
ncbi:Graves disease carrier protein [Orchesella cincta]|uniref:Graves disease carrier protein n=1 Tax=Orchesella cincta TaxID=48709 RepID=A0A1D2NKA7_ORCCI|nr:Graves disease carrier protein [Orchesella cincta]